MRTFFAIASCAAATSPAIADITYIFEGSVDSVVGFRTGVFSGAQAGDSFSLTFSVDPDAISSVQGAIGLRRDVAPESVVLDINGVTRSFGFGTATVGDDDPIDFFGAVFEADTGSIDTEERAQFTSSFGIFDPPPIEGTDLPTQSEIDGLDFLNLRYGLSGPGPADGFDIEFDVLSVTVVPAPSTATGLAVLGVVSARRRRRR